MALKETKKARQVEKTRETELKNDYLKLKARLIFMGVLATGGVKFDENMWKDAKIVLLTDLGKWLNAIEEFYIHRKGK